MSSKCCQQDFFIFQGFYNWIDKVHKSWDHRVLSQDYRGMWEVRLPLSRSVVWKGDKVHYARLHLGLSHEIRENKITQHLRLWHSSKSTRAGIYSSIYSQVPFLKGQKGFFIFIFLSLWIHISFSFFLMIMRAQTLLW